MQCKLLRFSHWGAVFLLSLICTVSPLVSLYARRWAISSQNAFNEYLTLSSEYGIKHSAYHYLGRWRSEPYSEVPTLDPVKISFLSQIATLTDRIEELEAKIKINTNYERRLERLESRLGVDSENHLDAQIFNDMVWTRALWSQIGRPTCLGSKTHYRISIRY